jgi:WD40 repeat protein
MKFLRRENDSYKEAKKKPIPKLKRKSISLKKKIKAKGKVYLSKVQKLLAEKYGLILQAHTDDVYCVAISSDNKYVVSSSKDNTLRVWNLNNKMQESVLQGHTGFVNCVAITSDNKYVVSGCQDSTVRLWDFHNKSKNLSYKAIILMSVV